MVTRRLTIHGRVQGVFYRGWSVAAARSLGLNGWVRNRRDGSVEAVFAGDEQAVAEMVKLCRRGPDAARVASVEEQPAGPDELNLRKNGERFSELNTV